MVFEKLPLLYHHLFLLLILILFGTVILMVSNVYFYCLILF